MIIFDADDPLVLNGTYDQEGFTPKERRAQARKQTAASVNEKGQPPMRLFHVGKVGLTCDAIAHATEKRKDGEVKVIVLTLRVQPFDAKLATALHPDVRTTLFKLSHPDPHPHLARVNFSLGVPRQALDIYATPDTAKATMRLDHVKVTGIYARTQNGMTGYACILKATFGPVSDKELGFVEAWRNGMKFVSFEEAERSAEFEDEAPDDDEADDDDDQPELPVAEFETDADGKPLALDTAADRVNRPLHSHQRKRGAKKAAAKKGRR
jgi:hypothetical protein